MLTEWVAFGGIALVIFGAIIGIYRKKKKGASINYDLGNDKAFDEVINMPD